MTQMGDTVYHMRIASRLCQYLRRPTAIEVAHHELAGAQRDLLHAQASKEYYEAMCGCLEMRVQRLKKYIMDEREQPSPFNFKW